MIESTTTYLLQRKQNLKDEREVYQFLKKSFPALQSETVYDAYFPFILSLLANICYPCSLNVLSAVLGKNIIHRQKVKRLVDKGLLKSYKMTIQDKGSRNAYYLSPAGIEALYSSLPLGLFEKSKVRRTGGLLPVHDYGVGLSLLQCLLREQPFSYKKEVLFASDHYKENGSLCVDAIVTFQGPGQTSLFIEQDMGTESPAVLARKLRHYYNCDLLQAENKHLIISSHAMIDNSCPSYNASALADLLKQMEERGADLVYSYYANNGEMLSPRIRNAIRAFLVRTDICDSLRDSGEPKDASELSEHDELVRNLRVKDFTLADLRDYVNALEDGTNLYKDIDYNKRQMSIAHHKLEQIAQYIITQIDKGLFHNGEVNLLLEGNSCYVLPTALLSNYFDMISGGQTKDLTNTLSRYFPGIEKSTYSYLSPKISYGVMPELQLRNCYQVNSDTYVCVEHVGKDLGGYVRVAYLNKLKELGFHANIHVVCVCDTPKEALSLASRLNYFPKNRQIETTGISYSFLLSHEIGTDDGIYLPTRLAGGSLLPIRSYQEPSDIATALSTEQDLLSQLEGLSMENLLKLVR